MTNAKLTRPIRACMFDLDGTLIDTLSDFHVALNQMLRELGRPELARDVVGRMVGKGSDYLLRSALLYPDPWSETAEVAMDDALYRRAWDVYQAAYEAINGRYSDIFPGVEEGLESLKRRGLALACLTNKPVHHARTLLAAKDLSRFFGQIFGGDSFARKKPDPLPLLETCRILGTSPAHTLMVGDSVNDAAAARAAGCPTVLVSYGYNHGRPVRQIDADAYLDRISELPGLL
ncbi:MAG: phosphoglycolate phosphatase [Burkholderiaceae bacterium]|nr:MAG: phosphoglycolate phosphatase [Burkholderiaceae bacterium]